MKSVPLSVIALASVLLAGSLAAAPQNADQKTDQKTDQKSNQKMPRGAAAVQQRVETLSKELKLTEAQKTKVEALFKEQAQKVREFRQKNPSVTSEQRREEMKTVRADQQKKMKEILTTEQYEKWEKMASEAQRNGRGGGQGANRQKKSE